MRNDTGWRSWNRGANRSSIFTRASRSSSAFWLASAARATASAIACPASSLYLSRSFLASSASTFWRRTTAYVEMPTTTAPIAATPKNINITFSHAWSDKPNIRLTFLEKFVFSIVAISCVGLLVIIFLALKNIWRGR